MSAKKPPPDPHLPLLLCEERAVGLWLPIPLSERLDRLLERLHDERRIKLFRKTLLAGLVLAAPETSAELEQLWDDLRDAEAWQAGLKDEPEGSVLEFQRRKPGPRPLR